MTYLKKISKILKKYPAVKLGYLFGSRARGDAGPNSDYDFAIYLHEKNLKKRYKIRFLLMHEISSELKVPSVDVVVINDCHNTELKFAIVTEGKLFYEIEPFVADVEPKILNEYFDFYYLLKKYNQTKT